MTDDTQVNSYTTYGWSINLIRCNLSADFPTGFFNLNVYISNIGNALVNPKASFQAPDGKLVSSDGRTQDYLDINKCWRQIRRYR